MTTTLVSACLLGKRCRYDGQSKDHRAVQSVVEALERNGHQVVAVCPEELGELGTPRPAAELRGGGGAAVLMGQASVCRVDDDLDVTQAFVYGARTALALAPGAERAILKARSPSCGCGQTHMDGSVQAGDGVFAALLRARGVALQSEEDLDG